MQSMADAEIAAGQRTLLEAVARELAEISQALSEVASGGGDAAAAPDELHPSKAPDAGERLIAKALEHLSEAATACNVATRELNGLSPRSALIAESGGRACLTASAAASPATSPEPTPEVAATMNEWQASQAGPNSDAIGEPVGAAAGADLGAEGSASPETAEADDSNADAHVSTEEAVRMAWRLRQAAVAERSAAEARLRSLRAERAGCLERLGGLGEERTRSAQSRRRSQEFTGDRELQLLAEINELQATAKAAQTFLQRLNDQLVDKGHLAITMSRRRRQVEQKHAQSAATVDDSRDILGLQDETERHVREVYKCCGMLEQELAEAQEDTGERIEELRAEWAEQEARFAGEEAELEEKIACVRERYAEKWAAAERASRKRVNERVRRADEARLALEKQLADLEAERESEAMARQAHLEKQQELVSEAKARAMTELEATLTERQQHIQARVAAESQRLGRLRGQQRRRADDLAREVAECRSNIQQVRESYAHRGSGQSEEAMLRLPTLGSPGRQSNFATVAMAAMSATPRLPSGGPAALRTM